MSYMYEFVGNSIKHSNLIKKKTFKDKMDVS